MLREVTAAFSAPAARLVRVGGFDLHVDEWVSGDRAHVLLLHGLGGNSVTWHGVAPFLAERLGGRVMAVDLPGFGLSRPVGRRVGIRLFTQLLAQLMQAEAPAKRFLVAGNSLGAALALELGGEVPERIAGIGLAALALPLGWGRDWRGAGSLLSWLPAAVPGLGRRLIGNYMRKTGLPGVVDEPIRALFGNSERLDRDLRERLLEVSRDRLGWVDDAARAYEETTRSLGIELLRPGGTARRIRSSKCPVQSIYGDRDPIFAAPAWEKLARVRPDWEHLVLPGVGHVPQLEAPDEVARALLTFGSHLW
jgi:pimeloyl-ACP methyl ester carboxylesterase